MANAQPPSDRRGFTLVEMAIVMLIMGILAAVAAPRLASAIRDTQVDAAAARIAADLRLARTTALEQSTSRSVQFTARTGAYTLAGTEDLNHRSQSDGTVAYSVDLAAAGYPARISQVDFPAGTVTFDWRGQPSSSGNVEVSLAGYLRVVNVNAAGLVTVQ